MNTEIISAANTAQTFATIFNKLIAGYSVKLGITEGINVIGLDSASPGRLAIIFYKLTGSNFWKEFKLGLRICLDTKLWTVFKTKSRYDL